MCSVTASKSSALYCPASCAPHSQWAIRRCPSLAAAVCRGCTANASSCAPPRSVGRRVGSTLGRIGNGRCRYVSKTLPTAVRVSEGTRVQLCGRMSLEIGGIQLADRLRGRQVRLLLAYLLL